MSRHPPVAFKILTAAQYSEWEKSGTFSGAGIDVQDGYIHLSTAETSGETFDKYFASQQRETDLVVVEVVLAKVRDEVKWEASRGGQLFPHVYGSIGTEAIGRTWRGGQVDGDLFKSLVREQGSATRSMIFS